MPWIDETWLRRAFEALQSTLKVDNHLRRQMIQFLYDEGFWDVEKLTWAAAEARFNGCLNPNKADFFKIGEAWALMKRFGRHELFLAMADDLGYEVRRRPTEERRLELLERIAIANELCAVASTAAAAELARLDAARVPTGAPATAGSRPNFSLDGTRTEVP